MEPSAPAFDVKQLEKLRVLQDESEPNAVANLARGFLSRASQRLGRMRALLSSGDAATLANEAHGLASSSGMFGLMRVRVHCKALENFVRDEGLADAGPLLADLERAYLEAQPLLMIELGLEDGR
ncbi:MAG TPA: Hpt domain-containing protein [Archangium sp.]|jgi:HPt (histidine-containing phosphotransfer) domain-containing protein|uniref:Hpt domain-containing protein n=1 Tax=Archangium sp. TaxID=1872627 RepID=UPI002ED7E2A1